MSKVFLFLNLTSGERTDFFGDTLALELFLEK
jgi:hypothetical protein